MGEHILDELHNALTRYVIFPTPESAIAVTLWVAATHAQPAWEHATRLGIVAPEKRCGKTRLLNIVEYTSHRPLAAVNATTAAVYRSIGDDDPPTVLFDEIDAIFGGKRAEDHEDLRALINAGHERGKPVIRCVGPTSQVQAFPSFAMVALAGIGTLPETIADRAVMIHMRRRGPGESVAPFRRRRDVPPLTGIRDDLHEWIREHVNHLADAEPEMPLEDRAADTWEPLIAVADLGGEGWPARARKAALLLVAAESEADAEQSLGMRLLADVKEIFERSTVFFMPSADLVRSLRALSDAPWSEYELTTTRLSNMLRPYGIRPGHNTARTARGYPLEAFRDPFARYLPSRAVQSSETASDLGLSPDAFRTPDGSTRPENSTRPDVSAGQAGFADDRTPSDATQEGTRP